MNAGGIVLCGGRSTKMGVPKATLPFGRETMLQRVVRLLGTVVAASCRRCGAGATDYRRAAERDPYLSLTNREQRGPLEGLRAGLKGLPRSIEIAYVTSCDVPLLVPGFVKRMIDLLGDYDIAVMEVDGFPHPLTSVYRRTIAASRGGAS